MTRHCLHEAGAVLFAAMIVSTTTVPVQAGASQASRGATRSAVTDARDAASRLVTKPVARKSEKSRRSHLQR